MDSIPVDELVGSLQSYELDLPKTGKSKSMALKSVDDVEVGGFDDELSTTEISYLVKNFRNFLRNSNRRARGMNTAEVSDDESGCDEDGNFIAFTATVVVNESVSAEENPFDGELSKDVDL